MESFENALYAYESAKRAVTLLLEVLEVCLEHPRPELAKWSSDFRPIIERFLRREQSYEPPIE